MSELDQKKKKGKGQKAQLKKKKRKSICWLLHLFWMTREGLKACSFLFLSEWQIIPAGYAADFHPYINDDEFLPLHWIPMNLKAAIHTNAVE